jgi:hypothetical protein
LDGDIESDHCLLYFGDLDLRSSDVHIYADLNEIYYSVKRKDRKWIRSTKPESVTFAFEQGDVRIIEMLQRNIPWPYIQQTYIDADTGVKSGILGSRLTDLMLDIVSKVITKVIFRI